MTYEKQDRTEDKGEFKRTIKGDYNIVIKRIDDDQLDTKSLLELSKKNGHSPVLIIQNNQLRIFGYKNRSNVSPGEWKLQELHLLGPENIRVKVGLVAQESSIVADLRHKQSRHMSSYQFRFLKD